MLESLSQIDASVSCISTDVNAFKNIRNRLFSAIQEEIKIEETVNSEQSEERVRQNKLYLYVFHLFESVIASVTQLVTKTMGVTLSQIPKDYLLEKEKETLNTIVTESDISTIGN